jgi:cystathionine beta-lyase
MLSILAAGDEVLVVDCVYAPTRRFCDGVLKRFGVATRYFPSRASADEVMTLVAPNTRLIVLETPGSLTFEMQDIAAIAAAARARGVLTLIDNTYAAGLLFKPLAHGVDLSCQALTKYVGGHSDLFMGSVAVADEGLATRLKSAVRDHGWSVSPDDAYLMLRGLRTLDTRLARHGASGIEIARWLETQPEVARVLHPALPGFPDHGLWKRDFSGASGLFSVELRPAPQSAVLALLDALDLFGLGFSWGGFESLAIHCDPQLKTGRTAAPWNAKGPIVRFHVGLEDPADLVADLRRGLDAFGGS